MKQTGDESFGKTVFGKKPLQSYIKHQLFSDVDLMKCNS